jgi:hypothetical protein
MTAKPPTPQGISALLRKAGFSRSVRQGRGQASTGYDVSKSYGDGDVVVRHNTWSMVPFPEARDAALARYAAAIEAAGYAVGRDGQFSRLIVSAASPDKPEENDR